MTLSTSGNNVIVVAHPDDEVLWSSSLPIRYPGNWTIICCSVPRRDSIRAYKFFDSCRILKVFPMLIPSAETDPDQDLNHLDALDLNPYDLIVTHNEVGEYGHRHHKNVHDYVVSNWSHKKIVTFGYRKEKEGLIRIEMTADEYHKKLTALKCYNHLCPYNGKAIPKWEALIHRYQTVEGIDFSIETFDEVVYG